jgi:sugar/nucleoside kinase (ribokinase family)
MERLSPLIERHRFVMLAATSDFDLSRRFLDSVNDHHGAAYLLLTSAGSIDRNQALELISHSRISQCNEAELSSLVGPGGGLVEQMCRFRELGTSTFLITTESRGLWAHFNGRWFHQRPFDLARRPGIDDADVLTGIMLAAIAAKYAAADALRVATVGAALHTAGVNAQFTLEELLRLSHVLPVRKCNYLSSVEPLRTVLARAVQSLAADALGATLGLASAML